MPEKQLVKTNNKKNEGVSEYLKKLMKLYNKCVAEGAFQVAVRVCKIIGEVQGFFQKNNDVKIKLTELSDKNIDALIKHLEH